jgi:hypothetical protein
VYTSAPLYDRTSTWIAKTITTIKHLAYFII